MSRRMTEDAATGVRGGAHPEWTRVARAFPELPGHSGPDLSVRVSENGALVVV
jgi:hypothetical protein